MAQFDLTPKFVKFLDRHMAVQLIEFLAKKQIYSKDDVASEKIKLISKTKMVESVIEEYALWRPDQPVPAEFQAQKEAVLQELKETAAALGPFEAILADPEKSTALLEEKTSLEAIKQAYKVTDAHVEALYRYGKLVFDCGMYNYATAPLELFRNLSNDEEKRFQALWGVLASYILLTSYEQALKTFEFFLLDVVEKRVQSTQLEQLQQRSWLLHWGLFIYFRIPDGPERLVDLVLSDSSASSQQRLLNAVQVNCPHLFRYLSAAVLLAPRPAGSADSYAAAKTLAKLLKQERTSYSDPVTSLLRALYSDCDVDTAYALLPEVEQLCQHDLFLESHTAALLQSTRSLLLELYSHTHQRIQAVELGRRLGLEGAELEAKLPELLQDVNTAAAEAAAAASPAAGQPSSSSSSSAAAPAAAVRATLSADSQHVLFAKSFPTIFQQVQERTKALFYRTTQLSATLDKRLAFAAASSD